MIIKLSMTEIIPAIMPKSFSELEEYANKFSGLVDSVQIDVMDGVFVPETSWPYTQQGAIDTSFKKIVGKDSTLPKIETLGYELDLMIDAPEKGVKSWTQVGASKLIFHMESIKDKDWFWKQLAHVKTPAPELGVAGVEMGISINTSTSNEEIYPYIDKADFVQCMGISKIGFQGQPFDEAVLPKIEDLRVRFPELIISVDGGVTPETAPRLIEAGANRLVSGSAILKSDDIKKTIKELTGI